MRARGLSDDERGAVYVEFIIAFMPFFIFFLCLWQVSILFAAKIVIDHAANQAARSAAVIFGEDPALFSGEAPNVANDSGQRMALVQAAAELAAASMIVDRTVLTLTVSLPDYPNSATIPPMNPQVVTHMRARVVATMDCKIMLANAILCSTVGATNGARFTIPITSEGDFPYMGAPYGY